MKRKIAFVLMTVSLFLTVGFSSSDQAIIDEIQKDIKSINQKINNLDNRIWNNNEKYKQAVFTAPGEGYSRVDSEEGMFFITYDKKEPYMEGKMLTFTIGNPQSCSYVGFELTVAYTENLPGNIQTISCEYEETLYPGWNTVYFYIPNKNPNYIQVTIKTNVIDLQKNSIFD